MSDALHPLLKVALEAHGGHDRWVKFKGIASTILTGGKLWELKGAPLISRVTGPASFVAAGVQCASLAIDGADSLSSSLRINSGRRCGTGRTASTSTVLTV